MVGVAFVYVLNAEVVDNEDERNWAPLVSPESGRGGALVISVLVELFSE